MKVNILWLCTGALAANLGDFFSTVAGISLGAYETNALFAPVYESSITLAAFYKLILVSAVICLPVVIYMRQVPKVNDVKVRTCLSCLTLGCLIFANLTFWSCLTNNLIVIWRLI